MAAAGTDEIVGLLRARGGRATPTRRAVITALLHAGDRHLGAEEIAREVREAKPSVAESTIYRTLATLEDLGVVAHVHMGHGPSTYHLAQAAHRHLVCDGCGAVIEVPDAEFADLEQRLNERYGFKLSGHHFALAGVCRACRGAD
jgi:Fur family transcriptional regulator, ferric uptake regulator